MEFFFIFGISLVIIAVIIFFFIEEGDTEFSHIILSIGFLFLAVGILWITSTNKSIEYYPVQQQGTFQYYEDREGKIHLTVAVWDTSSAVMQVKYRRDGSIIAPRRTVTPIHKSKVE